MSTVSFHSEQIEFNISNEEQISSWLENSCKLENRELTELSFIFCSDEYLLKVNRDYLQHDYYTDVITFDYSEAPSVSGDVFISIDRVSENASSFNTNFIDELHRVMIHGALHLMGYTDGSPADKSAMTAKEDYYLSLRAFSPN